MYVGCTSNLIKRLKAHNAGIVSSTKQRVPLVLIHRELYKSKAEAFNRERFLKSLWAGRFKRKVLEKYLDGLNHPKGDRPISKSNDLEI